MSITKQLEILTPEEINYAADFFQRYQTSTQEYKQSLIDKSKLAKLLDNFKNDLKATESSDIIKTIDSSSGDEVSLESLSEMLTKALDKVDEELNKISGIVTKLNSLREVIN